MYTSFVEMFEASLKQWTEIEKRIKNKSRKQGRKRDIMRFLESGWRRQFGIMT